MAEEWGSDADMNTVLFAPTADPTDGQLFESNSLSGGERNRVFFQRNGNYKEFTLVSGADFREDGRGFALFDVDGDGYLDMGITSPNAPRFRVMRNRIGDRLDNQHGFVQISLVGGQDSAEPSSEWSPRDAFGSKVLVTIGDEKRMYHLSLGEGLSGQNTKRIHVGMGEAAQIDSIEVRWPSGKTTTTEDVKAGSRIVITERQD
ncbi:MAG: ASPIC/UnbV domain-containing protein [Planctomycetota bacterium]